MSKIHLYNANLIGDTLMTTPVIRELAVAGREVILYADTEKGSQVLYQYNPYIKELYVVDGRPEVEGLIHLDAGKAFHAARVNNCTLVEGFGYLCNQQIQDLRYNYYIDPQPSPILFGPKDIVIARHSASCSSNDPRVGFPNKCIGNKEWLKVAKWCEKQGYSPVAVGALADLEQTRYQEWPYRKVYGEDLRVLTNSLPHAAAVMSVDTGLRHLAASCGSNLYCYSGAISLSMIRCVPIKQEQRIYEEHDSLDKATWTRLVKGLEKVLS